MGPTACEPPFWGAASFADAAPCEPLRGKTEPLWRRPRRTAAGGSPGEQTAGVTPARATELRNVLSPGPFGAPVASNGGR